MNLMEYKAQKPFAQKHLLCLQEYTADEILQLLSLAARLKAERRAGIPHPLLAGKNLAMIFAKPSARTRVSFETGIEQLGGHGLYISAGEIGLGERESVHDVANVFSRFVDGIMIRTFRQSDVEGLAQYGSVPVINGLTDDYHPCQALADMLTLYEVFGDVRGKKLVFVGDGNNVAHSLMIIGSKLGLEVTVACPEGYEPAQRVMDWAAANNAVSGGSFRIEHDPLRAVQGAHAIYTDVWASMGQEDEAAKRERDFAGFQVNGAMMAAALPEAVFLHCLPAHRGLEVHAEVIDGPQSRVFDEAENRLHAQKAVMVMLMGGTK